MPLSYAEGTRWNWPKLKFHSNPNHKPNPNTTYVQPTSNLRLHLGLEKKVDLRRINLDALKPWIADRIARLVTEEVLYP